MKPEVTVNHIMSEHSGLHVNAKFEQVHRRNNRNRTVSEASSAVVINLIY